MRIDSSGPDQSTGAGSHKGGADVGAKWQAQLQMAFLTQWPHAAAVSAERGQEQPSRAPSANMASEQATVQPRGPATPLAPLPFERQPTNAASAAGLLAPSSGTGANSAVDPEVLAPSERPAAAEECRAGDPTSPLAGATDLRDGEHISVAARSRSGGFLAAPPRYAKQLLQLSLDGVPQANLRDATLDAAAAGPVALSIAHELRTQGVTLQRIFINGQRFDATRLSAVNTTAGLQSRKHNDQE